MSSRFAFGPTRANNLSPIVFDAPDTAVQPAGHLTRPHGRVVGEYLRALVGRKRAVNLGLTAKAVYFGQSVTMQLCFTGVCS